MRSPIWAVGRPFRNSSRASRRRANARTCIRLSRSSPFGCHSPQVRRPYLRLAVTSEIPGSEVIGQNQHNVRTRRTLRAHCARRRRQHRQQIPPPHRLPPEHAPSASIPHCRTRIRTRLRLSRLAAISSSPPSTSPFASRSLRPPRLPSSAPRPLPPHPAADPPTS